MDYSCLNITNRIRMISILAFCILGSLVPFLTSGADHALELLSAREARDHADIQTLQSAIQKAKAEIAHQPSYSSYLKIANLETFLFEAASVKHNGKLQKEAAQAGVEAAEKEVELNPNSADAHGLLGTLLGELIPHVWAGGMRYGRRSAEELDKAIKLD